MAHIKEIYSAGDGWIRILDDKHPYPIPICPEGISDLIRYLRNSADDDGKREFYKQSLPRLKNGSEGRYILKLAIDNSDSADTIIQEIISTSKTKNT